MLALPEVTLACVDTREIGLALNAIAKCTAQARFADVKFFTQSALVPNAPKGVELIDVDVRSVQAYSTFMLRGLAAHVNTSHVLVVQWDGYVRDASRWDPRFLEYDYIGAPWHDQPPDQAVGNGGFSLRSRRLLHALQDPRFQPHHPEDLAICHVNRAFLEREHGIRIAPIDVAQRFSYERALPPTPTFGFHGLFNMHRVLSPTELRHLVESLPAPMCRGLDARDLCRTLLRENRLDTAAVFLHKRQQLRMRDRRTLLLRLEYAARRLFERPRRT